MSYYDFATKQQPKLKKTKRGFPLLALLSVFIAALLWLLPHHPGVKPAAEHKINPMVATTSQPIKSVVVNSQTQPTDPQLEFYQMLKSPEGTLPRERGEYSLQLAALTSVQAAQQVVEALKQHAFSAHIVTNSNGSTTHWSRVVLGPYNSETAAKMVQRKLEHMGERGILLISNKK